MSVTPEAVLEAILGGMFDGREDLIYDAVKDRSRMKARVLLAAINPGDKVIISNRVKPRYYAGRIGTVTKISSTKATIDLDEPTYNTNGRKIQNNINVPATLLEKVEA